MLDTDQIIADNYHKLYYDGLGWVQNSFLGFPIQQNPLDLQIYQEILTTVRPTAVIQTGVARGGSLLFFATILDALHIPPDVLVIGIDNTEFEECKALSNKRIRIIIADSIHPNTIQLIHSLVADGTALVSLDSCHAQDHVLKEIYAYRDLVAVGSYLVVEDININGHPVLPNFVPGPWEAVNQFLPTDTRFINDGLWEKNYLTWYAWLKRII